MLARIFGAFLLVFGLLPIVNWIPGGHEAPWYRDTLMLWLTGTAMVLGLTGLLLIASQRFTRLWPTGLWQRTSLRWESGGWKSDLSIASVALLIYVVIAVWIFDRRPTVVDEFIGLFQANIFASGRLYLPASDTPALTSALFVVEHNGRLFGQFPAGGPALLAIGSLFDVAWLVNPICGALSVLVLARMMRITKVASGVALATVVLFATSPFVASMTGSYMSHVPTLTMLLLAGVALAHATSDDTARSGWGFLCGLALGAAATIRPLDGLVFAAPTAVWLMLRLRIGIHHIRPLLFSGVGVAIPLAALFAVNYQWTGDPLVFGYEVLWGKSVGVGFGESPWGIPHTPLLGLELVNLYLLRLQVYLFESPVPSLVFAAVSLFLSRRMSGSGLWAFAGASLLLLGYFAYWFDGYHLGPRFLYPLAPIAAYLTARLPSALRDAGASRAMERAVLVAGLLAILIGVSQLWPIRYGAHRDAALATPTRYDDVARRAGVAGATILVRDAWSAQLIARMWALGVPHPEAERLQREVDECDLDTALQMVEQQGGGPARLQELLPGSRPEAGPAASSGVSSESGSASQPTQNQSAMCVRRMIEANAGWTIWNPALLVEDDNVWIRDLHSMNAQVVSPDDELWILRPDSTAFERVRLERLPADSVGREWGLR